MTQTPLPSDPLATPAPTAVRRLLSALGGRLLSAIVYVGGVNLLVADSLRWLHRSVVRRQVRFGRKAFYAQMCRLGAASIGVTALVSTCIGGILALQTAPPLAEFGQSDKVANIVAVAVLRELGPLISAVVLTGFAGAAVAAELGTMVVGEEIEAMQAHALNPIRFLVMPRVLATTLSMMIVCVLGDAVAILAGGLVGVWGLGIPAAVYFDNTVEQAKLADFLTGVWKAGMFGGIIGAVACYNGLGVVGGAAGVGRATTNTVVRCVVWIIAADLIFTALFYRLGWA